MREGWDYKHLIEVCDFQGGSQPPKEEWSKEPKPNYVRMLQIRDFTQSATDYIEFVKVSKSLKYCQDDDILLGRYGASVGKVLTGLSGAYNVAIIKAIPDVALVSKKYIKSYFLSPGFQLNLGKVSQHRAAQAGFSKDDIAAFPIPVPPIAEQEKIVAELDCLTGIIEKKRLQLAELVKLAQSIFYDMFGDPITNEKGWGTRAIQEVAPQTAYKGHIPSHNGKYWLLNLDMVEAQTGTILDEVLFDEKEIGGSTTTFNEEMVLYSKLRPYLNKVVLPMKPGYGTSELVPLLPDKSILNRVFLAYLLRSHFFVAYISLKVVGAKMPRVSLDVFRRFPVILPPLSLQNEFAQKIEAIEKQKEMVKRSIAETETLFNSRMDYWFN